MIGTVWTVVFLLTIQPLFCFVAKQRNKSGLIRFSMLFLHCILVFTFTCMTALPRFVHTTYGTCVQRNTGGTSRLMEPHAFVGNYLTSKPPATDRVWSIFTCVLYFICKNVLVSKVLCYIFNQCGDSPWFHPIKLISFKWECLIVNDYVILAYSHSSFSSV